MHLPATQQVHPLSASMTGMKADHVAHGVLESHRSLTIGKGLVADLLARTLLSIAEVMEGRARRWIGLYSWCHSPSYQRLCRLLIAWFH